MFLLGVSFLSFLPLMGIGHGIDFDQYGLQGMFRDLYESGHGYKPDRNPGSPAFQLFLAWLLKPIFLAYGIKALSLWVQWLNLAFTLGSVTLFFGETQKITKSKILQAIATLCFALHPLMIWHGFAFAEDPPALFFCLLCFRLAAKKDSWFWIPLCFGLGVGSKFFFLPYLFLVLHRAHFSQQKPAYGETFSLGIASFLSALSFYLVVFAAYNMDASKAFVSSNYGTAFWERPVMGWFLLRNTLHFWIPWAGFSFWGFCREKIQKKNPFASPYFIGLALSLCFLLPIWLATLVAAIFLVDLLFRFLPKALKIAQTENFALFVTSLGLVLVLFLAPYSKSYLLPALPLVVLLALHLTQNPYFWIANLSLTILPLFFHFKPESEGLRIWGHGYYHSLRHQLVDEFNMAPGPKTPPILDFHWKER